MRVYIHVPFCDTKCPYCAFGSITNHSLIQPYFKALELDLKAQIQALDFTEIKSVFIGGGTPSVAHYELYDEIFALLSLYTTHNTEITIESNPNSATLQWLEYMHALGVNRVSFGAQSFNKDKLKFLGRAHSVKDIFKAVQNAKSAGFKNINVDLMYSTKLDDTKMLKSELKNIAKLQIKHISAYALNLESGTPFFKHNEYVKDSPRLARYLFAGLSDLGFKQYEISNFGKPCKHNLGYWRGDDYIGVGAYSVGTLGFKRFYALRLINSYIKDPLARKIELLSKDDKVFERVFLGLRSKIGVPKKLIKNKQNLEILLKNGKLKDGHIKVYNKNFLLADELASFLF